MAKNISPDSPTPASMAEPVVAVEVDEAEAARQLSALDVLLAAKQVRQHDEIRIPKREGLSSDLHLQIQSLTDREFKDVADEAEQAVPAANRRQRRAGAPEAKETDTNMFLRLIVAKGVVDPPFGHPDVTSAHGVFTGEQVVQKVLLPGEIAKVAELIMDLSGFHENNIEFAKNS